MQSMVTKGLTSRELLKKGKLSRYIRPTAISNDYSFGWVNASYVYGLQIINAHMRRTLGTLTPWEQYDKAINL